MSLLCMFKRVAVVNVLEYNTVLTAHLCALYIIQVWQHWERIPTLHQAQRKLFSSVSGSWNYFSQYGRMFCLPQYTAKP
jgi:hypothetical protein